MLSPAEMRDAIEALYEEEHAKLIKIARFRAAACFAAPEDLLHEALTRALDGRRKCPADTDITAFLSNVMRSLANNWRKGRERHRTEQLPEDEEARERLFLGTGTIKSEEEKEEEEKMHSMRLEQVRALFEFDSVARAVVGLMYRYRGAALRVAAGGISTRELAAVLRRIRRRVEVLREGKR